jgi:hypothetical protein
MKMRDLYIKMRNDYVTFPYGSGNSFYNPTRVLNPSRVKVTEKIETDRN